MIDISQIKLNSYGLDTQYLVRGLIPVLFILIEIFDPAEPVFQHDYSDQTWATRFKALGYSEYTFVNTRFDIS